MRILFVASCYDPFSEKKGGGSQRSHLLAEAFAKVAQVDVAVCVSGSVSDIPNCNVVYSKDVDVWYHGFDNRKNKLKRLLKFWDPYSFFPMLPQPTKDIGEIIDKGEYDFICARYLETALQFGLMKYSDRLILDADDYPVDDMVKLSNVSSTFRARVYYYLLSIAMRFSVNKAISQCRYVFTPTKKLMKINRHTSWLPNVPFYEFSMLPPIVAKEKPVILFVGGLSYLPNLRGIEYFINKVYPLVLKKMPDVHLNIVGKCNDAEWKLKNESIQGIAVKGFVEDLSQEYTEADVCIAPIYAGAGTNIKVAETLQMHRPCVVSPIAYRGYEMLKKGSDIIVANSDVEYAEAIVDLLRNKDKREKIADNGYEKYKKYLSRQAFMCIVKESVESLSS